jgi:Holliday junction resolvase RusA-like endonuclease
VIAETADEVAPWTEVPDAVWQALHKILAPYVGAAFVVSGEPVPKERRIGEGRAAHTPPRTKAGEKAVRAAFDKVMVGWNPEPDLTYGILVELVAGASSRVDADNGLKLVMDALNKKMWQDDVQVGVTFCRITRGRGEPRTEVRLFAMPNNGTNLSRVCECGNRFRAKTYNRCNKCRTSRSSAGQLALDAPTRLAIEAASPADPDLVRCKRQAYRFVVATLAGWGGPPSTKDIATKLGVTETRAAAVINALIADGTLARKNRKLYVKTPMGAAA